MSARAAGASPHVLILGTDPAAGRGGIASALPGLMRALDAAGLHHGFIATHRQDAPGGRWHPWLAAFGNVRRAVRSARAEGRSPVASVHMGGGAASTARKALLTLWLRALHVPVVIHLHGPEVESYLARPLARHALAAALRPAQALAVLTPWWVDRLREGLPGGRTRRIAVVPNVLPEAAERAPADRMRGAGRRPFTVLALSRLVPGKGFEDVIDAAALLPSDVRIVVAGAGPSEMALRARAARHASHGEGASISFAGWVTGEAKTALMAGADVFCLPSRYDSFGMVFAEAMAAGLPIVALRHGPVGDVVGSGDGDGVVGAPAGILVDPAAADVPAALADAIGRLAADDARRAYMAAAARERAIGRFSSAAVAPTVRILFDAVASTEAADAARSPHAADAGEGMP